MGQADLFQLNRLKIYKTISLQKLTIIKSGNVYKRVHFISAQ